jgi:cytidine diphosphoramidate kinase
MIVWLVGLSGAGKTSIARELHRNWQAQVPATVLVDGDEIREIFRHDTSPENYNIEGRRANAKRIIEICRWLDKQKINVVCSILCIFPDLMLENRKIFPEYFEIFVDAPMEQLEARDGKGLYSAAKAGEIRNVVGVDIDFPVPQQPDLVIDNSKPDIDFGRTAQSILEELEGARR